MEHELNAADQFDLPLPELDVEAALICAALWTKDAAQARTVAEVVRSTDLERPAHQMLWSIWCELVTSGRAHGAASVLARLSDAGRSPATDTANAALRGIVTLGAEPGELPWHALDVAAAAYRREYARMAARLQQASVEASTDDLFDVLVQHGVEQRAAWNRLREVRSRLGVERDWTAMEGDPA